MATTEHDSLDSSKPISADNSELYEIKISGILDQHWQPWFEGLTLTTDACYDDGQGCTLITGPLADQPALHGILERIRDLNLTLISVRRLSDDPAAPDELPGASGCGADENEAP